MQYSQWWNISAVGLALWLTAAPGHAQPSAAPTSATEAKARATLMKAAEFLAKSHYVEETSTVGGVPCDHLALRNEMTDAQVWITKGSKPLLHRLVIT